MKATKLIVVAVFAVMALAIAGRASAGGGHGGGHGGSGHAAGRGAIRGGMGFRGGLSQRNRLFSSSYGYSPYYPYYGYGYFGNGIFENSDEADWGEQWTSLSEDNDGPYARSTRENPPGVARMWELPEK